MRTISSRVTHLLRNDSAATMVEYGLLISLIAVAGLASSPLGTQIKETFAYITGYMN